ncbi:hypothetical protein [Variovorax paradoxus]|uniref:hypothetical protein n=1 Tax=Variovorax paradoxus TaxID=34073 RepID=UPI001ABCA52F
MTALSDQEKLALAVSAVDWLLRRMKEDPRLAYLIGFGSESFERLTAAGAAIAGEDADPFREQLLCALQPQPVPGIGKTGAVVDGELLARIAKYDDGVHDLDVQDDLDMLVSHFVRRGLDVAEAERDDRTGSLF